MNFINLGVHSINVRISQTGKRMVKYGDLERLLGLSADDTDRDTFVDAKIITSTLFDKIFKEDDATSEQKVIYDSLCTIGVYPLIDEACGVNLSTMSYFREFATTSREREFVHVVEKDFKN